MNLAIECFWAKGLVSVSVRVCGCKTGADLHRRSRVLSSHLLPAPAAAGFVGLVIQVSAMKPVVRLLKFDIPVEAANPTQENI